METREVVRCECGLNQFMTRSGLCRKTDCGKPLKPLIPNENFYRPEFTGCLSRAEALISKQIIPAFNTSEIIKSITSNVRPRKYLRKINKQPRYNREYLSLPGFPTELRLRCLQYAKEKGMSLRDVVIKSLENMLDKG